MKKKNLLPIFLVASLLITQSAFSQESKQVSIICGKIIVNPDSIQPLRPVSVILQKEWPVTYQQFEQQDIDTADNSFRIAFETDQITYGIMYLNFFPQQDSTYFKTRRYPLPPQLPDGLSKNYALMMRFTGLRLVCEPGDSVYIVINFDQPDPYFRASVTFSGPAGANNNLLRKRDNSYQFNKSFKLPLEEGLQNEDFKMSGKLRELDAARDSISSGYYQLLKTNILFNNLSAKHALIRASLYGSDMKIEQKRSRARQYYSFMDTLTLKPAYLKSPEFRLFLDSYLEYLNRIITGRDVPFSQNDKGYGLAKAVFADAILRPFLFEHLAYELEIPFIFNQRKNQYYEFIENYPDTPESYRLSELYNRHVSISNGRTAPELKLRSVSGQKRKLSDLRGKVVIATNVQALLHILHNEHNTEQLGELCRKFGRDLAIVVLDDSEGSERLNKYVDYYVVEDQNSKNLSAYSFHSSTRYSFIIGKDGTIRDCVYNLPLSEKDVSGLINERYTIFTKLKQAAESHSGLIVFLLSFLISITLVFLLVARIKRNRQVLVERHLHSELKAIRSQLNPHFLFNALNSIQNFINRSDPETANKHLASFSVLMRRVIELSDKDTASLSEELEFNKKYIELEQLRYGFSFTFDTDKSMDLQNTEIPSMIIQPFVENAVVHAMSESGTKGELHMSVSEAEENKILIEITDNGPGFPSEAGNGYGLKNSRERIDLLNAQSKAKIELFIVSPLPETPGGGTRVQLYIPKKY